MVTAWPAYKFGFIKKDDLLDMFVGSGTGRYVRLGIVTLVWALVTALLVQLFVEGGRWWSATAVAGHAAARGMSTRLPLLGLREPHPLRRRRVAAHAVRFHHFSVGGDLSDRGRRGARRAGRGR